MTRILRLTIAAALAAKLLLLPSDAAGIPAFARQSGASCNACHYQQFPTLTPYGRLFKASGYTLSAGATIDSHGLSLSRVLNASVVMKLRYLKTNGTSGAGSDVGEFALPDEAGIWLGGRAGSAVGYVLEAQMSDPDAAVFASFKMPIGVETPAGRVSIVPFSTSGLGAPFGFELLNTGAVGNASRYEDPVPFSAAQYVTGGAGEGRAEGIAFVLSHDLGFVNVTAWTPHHGTVALSRPAWYTRAAFTPRADGLEMGVGFQRWSGHSQVDNGRVSAWGVDFQVQGLDRAVPVAVYAGYARAPGSDSARNLFFNPLPNATNGSSTWVQPPVNVFNPEPFTQQAASVLAEVGVWPAHITLSAGYRFADNGRKEGNGDDAVLIGGTYLLAQNIQIQLSHTVLGSTAWNEATGRARTTVTLFAAF